MKMKNLLLLTFFCFSLFAEEQGVIEDSVNRIIKLNEQGITPRDLKFKHGDGILFVYNDTSKQLATLEIDYGKNKTHCASANLEIVDGKARTKNPLGPKDFAVVCFPAKGLYPYKILGINNQVFNGEITVE